MKKVLNVGCGNESYGTHRIDIFKTDSTTDVSDLNKPFPYKDNFFDEVYSSCVLEHIKNLDNFAHECFRVLKKGGKIYIKTDNAGYIPFHLFGTHEHNNFLKIQYRSKGAYGHKKGNDAHYHLFVPSHLTYLFSKFRKHKIFYEYGGRNKFYTLLLKLIPKKMGAIHLGFKAVK